MFVTREGAIRRSLSMLSLASWWTGALVHSSQQGASLHPEREGAWAQASLEATSAAIDLLQRVSTSLLSRRDAVLQTMELTFHRRLTSRTAPIESRDLFGSDFDRLMTQWSQRDQEDRVVAAPHHPQVPQRPRGGQNPPFTGWAQTNPQASGLKRRRQKNKSVQSTSSAPPPHYHPPKPGAGRGRGSGKRGGK